MELLENYKKNEISLIIFKINTIYFLYIYLVNI